MEDGKGNRDDGGEESYSTSPADPIDETPEEHSARRFRLRASPTSLITTARRSSYQDRRRRAIWYFALQFSRLPTTILAGVSYFWWDNIFLTILFIVLAVPAPAVAVVIANEQGPKQDKRMRNVYKPGLAREMAREQLADPHAGELPGSAESPPSDNLPAVIDQDDPARKPPQSPQPPQPPADEK